MRQKKKQYFLNKVSTSSNNVKAAWKIIKGDSGNFQTHNTVTKINCEGQALTKLMKSQTHLINTTQKLSLI
jgi:hypothetical protein